MCTSFLSRFCRAWGSGYYNVVSSSAAASGYYDNAAASGYYDGVAGFVYSDNVAGSGYYAFVAGSVAGSGRCGSGRCGSGCCGSSDVVAGSGRCGSSDVVAGSGFCGSGSSGSDVAASYVLADCCCCHSGCGRGAFAVFVK
jgi:uncharacterized low-complexity protein